jgi:hypothetical protein
LAPNFAPESVHDGSGRHGELIVNPLSRHGWLILTAVLITAVVIDGILRAAAGVSADVTSYEAVATALASHPLHVYSAANAPAPWQPDQYVFHWPYPPGFLPWIRLSDALRRVTSVPFDVWIRIPGVVAPLGLALVVQEQLGRAGKSEGVRLGAAALIALGPVFILDSFDAQIDGLAILPATIAVGYWLHGGRQRSLVSGVLIGVGTALKTVPILTVLALLPTARNNRERVELLAIALAVPVATALPFVARDPAGVVRISRYTGIPGFGGLSMLVQPRLIAFWLNGEIVLPSPVVTWMMSHAGAILGIAFVVAMAALVLRRTDAVSAALLLWLLVFVASPSVSPLYLCWGLPFILLAGKLRLAFLLQALAAGPAVLLYLHPPLPHKVLTYVLLMALVWLACLSALVLDGRSSFLGRPAATS